MINTSINNKILPQVISNISYWHHQRNLIEGTTDWAQTKKLFEEFIEVVAAQIPGEAPQVIVAHLKVWLDDLHKEGRIKSVHPDEANTALKDGLGDMGVVAVNLAERNEWTYGDCLHHSYLEIQHRKGKMINGTFVKESDLPTEATAERSNQPNSAFAIPYGGGND